MNLQELVTELIAKIEPELSMVVSMDGSMPNLASRAAGGSMVLAIKAYIVDSICDLSAKDAARLCVEAYDYMLALSQMTPVEDWELEDHLDMQEYYETNRDLVLAGKLDAVVVNLCLDQIITRMILVQSRSLRRLCRPDILGLNSVFHRPYDDILLYFNQLDALNT